MIYRVDDDVFHDIDAVLDYCICEDYHSDDYDEFEEWVNDAYGFIAIAVERYYAYDILDKLDENTLDSLRDDYCESENDRDREDARYELEHADPGDRVECQGYTSHVEEEQEEQEEPDNDVIETTRANLEAERVREIEEQETEINAENEYLKMFQVIGA